MKTNLLRLAILIFLFADISSAQFYFFGRNKVQYEKFDWKILRTDHFNIYYYDDMEEVAQIGAYYAEEIYNELKVKFNHVVTQRIPLIFYNTSLHFQQTNTTPGFIPDGVGGFFEFLKGRVVIPSNGSLHDFRHVIRHELVHVFMVTKIYRILIDHRLKTDILPPLWFVEGLAEYYSTEIDAQAEMVMRDAVINNYFVGLKDMYMIYGSFLMYKEGQSFLEFVEAKYGKEKVMLMIENFWMFTDFEKVIEHTLNKRIEDIDREWLLFLKQKYYSLFTDRVPVEHSAKKITKQGFNFSPVYYKHGEKEYIYFPANRDGYSSLYRIELSDNYEDENDPELILRGEKTDDLEGFHLFQSGIDISDNERIIFVTKSGATDVIHFYSIEEDDIVHTFQRDELVSISSPKFLGDDQRIVFQATDRKGFSDIYLFEPETDILLRLTNDIYDDRDPSEGLNNNEIIFSSDRTSGENEKKYNLFTINSGSGEIKYVTNLNSNNYTPMVSPDRSFLLFTSDHDGVRNIWKMELSEGNYNKTITKVTSFLTSAFNPSFIDSESITFCGFENFAFNIYTTAIVVDSAKEQTQLTFITNVNSTPWTAQKIITDSERDKLRYEKEYTLDYAQSQITTDPVYGTRGGAILSLSDLLGDDNYFFLLYNTAQVQSDFLKSFNIAIERIDLSKRANYGYGIFHFSGRRYDIRDSEEFYFERSFGGFFLLNFPLSKFQRIEAAVTAANSDKQVISGVVERKALLLSNSVSYVMDNSIWGPSGPLDGIRARLLLGYTSDIKYSNVNYFTVIADYRHYFRLGLRSAIAFRSALFYNEGKESRRYFMGGSWDLRGWPRWSIRGEKLWISSLEFRYPLIDHLRIQFPFFGLSFFSIRAATFFDAGGAWDTEYNQTLGSVGAGIRFNLFGLLVLRYDIGKKIENNFTQFQDGLFYQFFFGWDF